MKLNQRRKSKLGNEKRKPWVLLSLGCGLGIFLSAVTVLNVQVNVQRFRESDFSIGVRRTTNTVTAIDDPETKTLLESSPITNADSTDKSTQNEMVSYSVKSVSKNVPASSSTAPLQDIKILVAIAAFDFNQIPHLEDVLDSYHDIAIAGASVDVVIHASVAYPVTYIDLLNSRFTSKNYSISIVLKPSTLRLHLVDCHRELFYEKIDDYDLFIYTEEDIRVTPGTVSAYLQESQKIKDIMANNQKYSFSDFNVGIVRYEHNYPSNILIDDKTRHAIQNVTRVYWEHSSHKPPLIPNAVDVVPQGGEMSKGYVHMKNHHQGMFLATRDLLLAWKDRPNCNFNVVTDRPGTRSQPSEGTQRVWMSSQQLFGKRHCNVQQAIPIDKFGALTVHHVPNKNYRRVGKYRKRQFSDGTEEFDQSPDLLTALQLHLMMRKAWPGEPQIPYGGTVKMVDEVTERRTPLLERRLKEYQRYVRRGGVLSEDDFTHTALVEES